MNKKNEKSNTVKSKKAKKVKSAKALPVKETFPDSAALVVPASDSANVLAVESADVSPDADSSADDAANVPQLPTPEQLGISITAGNADGLLKATVGDTIVFPVKVSWSVNGSAILVVPTSSANAKGLLQVGMSQESSRSVKDGKEVAQITFNYKILVQDTGNLNIPAMRFEIPTPMGQSLDLLSESVSLHAEPPANPLPFVVAAVVALCLFVAGFWRFKRRAAAKASVAAKSAFENSIREHMMVLKQRVNVADSREWLLELEGVCKEFVALRLGKDVSAVNLDNLVKDGQLEGWERIADEFAHARYGGGKRDSFENKETWKAVMELMGLKEE